MNPINCIYEAMAQNGIEIIGQVQDVRGKWQRFRTPSKRNLNAYVYIYPHGLGALIGDWAQSDKSIYVKFKDTNFIKPDYKKIRIISEENHELRKKYNKECNAIWDKSHEVNLEHPYLVRKKISPFHIRQFGNFLICPLYNQFGQLRGLQSISPNGTKKFKKGSALKGSFMLLGEEVTDIIRLAEGYATGASIHMATGDLTAISYSAFNLEPVAIILKRLFIKNQIIICSDPKEIEINYAKKAARAIGCQIHSPVSENNHSLLDFNDIHCLYGIEALQGQLCSSKGFTIKK